MSAPVTSPSCSSVLWGRSGTRSGRSPPGGADYVTKPFQAEEVLARVRTHLKLYRLTQQLRNTNAELSRYIEELQQRNEELDAFSHTVAHDIKGPLAILVGYSELLLQDRHTLSEETIRECIEGIHSGANRLCNIVDELLLLASIRKADVVPQPLDMRQIVDAACERLADVIRQSQAEIILPPQWPVALGHAAWVEEVWVNYISNGCKYGGRPPRLELGWDKPEGGGVVRFWVRDNGDGIPPELQERLFVPFTRLDHLHVKGHGLGLSIVRRIVEK